MDQFFSKIGGLILSGLIVIGGAFGITNKTVEPVAPQEIQDLQTGIEQTQLALGANIPGIVAKFETSLASGIASSDTSMTLVKGTNSAGNALSGYICFVIDEGTTSEEFTCGTASSTTISAMLRGIDPIDGDLEVTALKKAHRRGATVKITDHPGLSIALRILNGDETIPNIIKYSGPKTFTASSSLVDKNYVDTIAIAGGVVASESVAGISVLATQTQTASGTATSGAYALIPQNKYFNSTCSATTTGVVTKTNGKISRTCIDDTEAITLSGGVTSTGITTLSNTIIGGTSSTVNSSNFNITSPTTTFSNVVLGATPFGGDGSDGDFTATSTVFNLQNANFYVKNFNNLNITGTSSISFINPSTTGTIVMFRIKGNATITSASSSAIDLRNMGGVADSQGPGLIYASNSGITTAGGIGWGPNIIKTTKSGMYLVTAGAGGTTAGGAGGIGAGAILIEVRGSYNFTGTMNATGGTGVAGAHGGGGGAGGSIVVVYNTLVANSGTYSLDGGVPGNGPGSGTGGGGGGNRVNGGTQGQVGGNDDGTGGQMPGGAATGVGGGGAGGYKIIEKNTTF